MMWVTFMQWSGWANFPWICWHDLFKRRPISTIRMIGLIVYTYTLPNRLDVSTETCTSLLCFDAISLSICMQRPRKCLQCLGVGNNVRSAHSAISSFFKPQCILSGRCHFFNVQALKWSILWMMIHHELFCILYAMASVRPQGCLQCELYTRKTSMHKTLQC